MASDEGLDRLFASPPGEFVRERDALAARLASAHDPRAREVKAIPKPTIPVWALNQLARERPEQIAALLEAGERLREAQRNALQGKGGESLRTAGAEVADLLARLVEESAAAAGRVGAAPTAGVLKRIEDGLRAVALTGGELASRLRAGRIEREPEPPRLETIAAAAPVARARAGRTEKQRLGSAKKKQEEAAKAAAQAERSAALANALRRNERDLERLQREAAEAARRADEARQRLDRARAELEKLNKHAGRGPRARRAR